MKPQAHLFVVKIWLEKAKNMVLFCVLRLWHINLRKCRAQNKLAVKQKGTREWNHVYLWSRNAIGFKSLKNCFV